MSIFNSSIIAHKQCVSHVVRVQHVSYMQNFLRHGMSHTFVCKLGRELYVQFHLSACMSVSLNVHNAII